MRSRSRAPSSTSAGGRTTCSRSSAESASRMARSTAMRAGPYTNGNKLPYSPEYTGNLGAELALPMGGSGLEFVTRLDGTFVGETWFHPVQTETVPNLPTGFGFGQGNYSKQKRDPYQLLNARMSLRSDRWSATAWGRNVTDEEYLQEVIVAPEFGGAFIHDSPGVQLRARLQLLVQMTRADFSLLVAIARDAEQFEVDLVVVLAEGGRWRADAARALRTASAPRSACEASRTAGAARRRSPRAPRNAGPRASRARGRSAPPARRDAPSVREPPCVVCFAVHCPISVVELLLVRAARLVAVVTGVVGKRRLLHRLAEPAEHRVLVGGDQHEAVARRIDVRRGDVRQDRRRCARGCIRSGRTR